MELDAFMEEQWVLAAHYAWIAPVVLRLYTSKYLFLGKRQR